MTTRHSKGRGLCPFLEKEGLPSALGSSALMELAPSLLTSPRSLRISPFYTWLLGCFFPIRAPRAGHMTPVP